MKSLDTLKTLMAAGALAVVAGAASASTCTYSETVLDVADAGTRGASAAKDCGNFSTGEGGNTTLSMMNGPPKAFGILGSWTVGDKFDTEGVEEKTILGKYFKITVTEVKDNDPEERIAGTWSLLDGFFFPEGESFALALKAGPNSFVYLLDNDFTSGTWSTVDLDNKGLSNITLFGTTTPIPLPAAGWLLLGGLGALGFAARRKRKMVA